MNTNAEIGSSWNGRILLRIAYKITDTPIIKTKDLTDDNELKIADSVRRSILWTVHFKLYCAYYLPKEYKKYSIKVLMQDSKIVFEEKRTINEFIEWNLVKTLQFYSLSDDVEQLPDMFFIYRIQMENRSASKELNPLYFI
ncbi:MAG: hypothetical protein IKG82_00645 [Oscillospiraceae bacterium]|nr:hypothetical protein [Oscillospiraceae bacterium]